MSGLPRQGWDGSHPSASAGGRTEPSIHSTYTFSRSAGRRTRRRVAATAVAETAAQQVKQHQHDEKDGELTGRPLRLIARSYPNWAPGRHTPPPPPPASAQPLYGNHVTWPKAPRRLERDFPVRETAHKASMAHVGPARMSARGPHWMGVSRGPPGLVARCSDRAGGVERQRQDACTQRAAERRPEGARGTRLPP